MLVRDPNYMVMAAGVPWNEDRLTVARSTFDLAQAPGARGGGVAILRAGVKRRLWSRDGARVVLARE